MKEKEENFRKIFHHSNDAIFVIDPPNDKILEVNSKACQMLGYSRKELVSMRVSDIHPYEMPKFLDFTNSVTKNGHGWTNELTCHTKNGDFLSAEISASTIGLGERNCIIAMVRDITERKQSEEMLRENLTQLARKNRYETIFSTVTRTVHQSINLQEVLENAVESMSKNIDKVQIVAIYLVEGEEAVIRSHRGFTAQYIEKAGRIPYPKGFNWKTIIEGKPIYVADVDKDDTIGPAGREIGIKSYLCMPVYYQSKTIGAIGINSFQKDAFDQEELNLLEIVREQIGIAINNAKQAETLREALVEVEQLKNRLQAENIYLQEEIKTEYNFEEIVGQSEALKKVLEKVEQVAPTNTTVLIQGETGTGKELIARAILNLSPRRGRPLVKVNCAAISAGLVESELFGHEKGAFTGAVQQRVGRFELADGGTIFLDEVGDLHIDTQIKLLRVLQEGEFERVGSSKSIKVDLRIIAATNRDLVEAVNQGTFRSYLFYRLSVLPIYVPSLRERKSDIILLVNFFLDKFAKILGKTITGVSKDSMNLLVDYSWLGNIRELQNVIERAVVLARDPVLHIDESMILRVDARADAGLRKSDSKKLEDLERSHILNVLEETGWVIEGKQGAASILGLNPSTLRSRMRKVGIKKPV